MTDRRKVVIVGAGFGGLAAAKRLEREDVDVTLVDRRHAAGGHWHDAYPFVQLHQASVFYGVASTVLGTGAVQQDGPECGLQERARRRARTERTRAKRSAGLRFWFVLLVLLAVSVALSVTIWREIERLFGL